MKKIEIVWCQLLFEVLEKRQTRFQIQELASKLGISLSTVHHSLINLRQMGAIEMGGNGGQIIDTEKILMHWANNRKLDTDIVFRGKVCGQVTEVEGLLPAGSILGAYSAVVSWYKEAPADYSTVYVYHSNANKVIERFKGEEGDETELVVLQLDKRLPLRGETTSLGHTFVDLWNIKDWMTKDFIKRIRQEIDEVLS
ncbi:MAG: HTH domain-containing protein [Candidatus Beckwithbacteria bacterium]|nr:HTH domain-containing protein [Patescibacteria group bacterium]